MSSDIRITVRSSGPLRGSISVPGDKSMSHRAVMLAGLAEGVSHIRGFLPSEDCRASAEAMRSLGATVEFLAEDELIVTGTGGTLRAPSQVIDCGNSGTTMRLLCGLIAPDDLEATLTGDASLCRRPMKRIAEPLERMGAKLVGQGEKMTAPVTVRGGSLHPVRYELPVASAQVKSAVLLAGMRTPGVTTVVEPIPTRDHTERMFQTFGVSHTRCGTEISVQGPQIPTPANFTVPGDISSAAFWLVAAAAKADSSLDLINVGLNPTRTGILTVLTRMGADVTQTLETPPGEGEPKGRVTVKASTLRGVEIGGDIIPNVIDELPALAVAAALAQGRTVIRDAAELRVKESDRIAIVAGHLRAMGASVEETPDGMIIDGARPLHGAVLASHGDHRIAMAFSIAGLFATGETTILDAACVNTSYPGFSDVLASFQTPS